jgi:hypothetical protein
MVDSGRFRLSAASLVYSRRTERIRRKYSDVDIAAVLGGNFRRLPGDIRGG